MNTVVFFVNGFIYTTTLLTFTSSLYILVFRKTLQ